MKGSIVTSGILHAIVLAMALLALGSPPPMEVQNTESMPISIVPIEELTQIQQGEKKAPMKDKSSPKATKRQDKVDNAENSGENNVDLKNPPTPSKRPVQTEAAAAPKPVEQVQPKQDETPTETKVVQKEETAAPPEKVTPTPKPDVKPTPAPEPTPEPTPPPEPAPTPKPEETAKAEDAPVPDAVPLPSTKPTPEKPKPDTPAKEAKPVEKPKPEKPKPDTTKTDQTKTDQKEAKATPSDSKSPSKDTKKGKEKKETAKSAASMQTDQLADEVSALLNKEDSAGGGAKRSNQEASLGGKKTTGGSKLSQTEMDALKGAIQNNWNVIPGMMDAANIRIRVAFHLDKSGAIVGDPEATVTGGDGGSAEEVLKRSAVRAVMKSAPFSNLPPDKYDAWSDVVVNFDPSDFM
jgi:outer membrane biosynthesis protein TonB